MKKLILLAMVLQGTFACAQSSNAASLRFNWTHSGKDTSGTPVVLTSFRAYFDLEGTATLSQIVEFGPPLPTATSVDANGVSSYSVLISSPAFTRGSRFCFQMVARLITSVETLESDRTAITCIRIPNRPATPGVVSFP